MSEPTHQGAADGAASGRGAPDRDAAVQPSSAAEAAAAEEAAGESPSAEFPPAKSRSAESPSAGSATEGASAAKVERPGRWRRRLFKVAALVVAMRVVLGVGLEPALRAALSAGGVKADWSSLQLQLVDGRVEVQGLSVTPKDDPEDGGSVTALDAQPMIAASTLVLDLDVSSLLKGALRVERLVLEGAAVNLDRGAEGDWNFAVFAGGGAPAAPPEPSVPGPLLFDLPFEVDQVRIQDFRLRVRDLQALPPVDLTSTTSLTLTGVGAEGEPAALDLRTVSAECLDLLRLRGTGALSSQGADLSLELTVAGLRPGAALGFLAAAGIDPRAERLDGAARLQLQASPLEANPNQLDALLTLDRVAVRADETEAFGLEHFEVKVDTLGEGVFDVDSILIDGLLAEAALEADGTLTFAGIGPAAGGQTTLAQSKPAPSNPAPPDPPSAAAKTPTVAPTAGPSAAGRAAPLRWSLSRAELKNSRLSFSDRDLSEGHRITALLGSISAGPISSEEGAPPSPVRLSATIPGVAEELRVDGSIGSIAPRFQASGGIKIAGLTPEELAPYLAMAGMEPAFESGTFEVDKIDVDGLTFAARGLRVTDGGDELAAMDMAEFVVGGKDGIRASLGGARGRVRRRLDDSVEAVGLRFNVASGPSAPTTAQTAAPITGEPVATAPSAPTTAPSEPFVVPKVWLPRLDLQFERLDLFSDQSSEVPISIGPITVKAGRVDGADAGPESFEASASGTVRVAREFSASVRFDGLEDGGLRVRGSTAARGLNLDPVKEWFELLGVEPELQDGALDGRFELGVRAVEGRPELALAVGPVRLADQAGSEVKEWLDLKELRVEGMRIGGDVTAAIESLRLTEPRLRLERDAAGGWTALGMHVLPPESAVGPAPTRGTQPDVAPALPTPSGWLSLNDGRVDGASVTLVDLGEAAEPPLILNASLGVQGLAPGAGAQPAECSAQLAVGGARWSTSGSLRPDPAAPSLELALAVEGVGEEALERFLPEGVALSFSDGVARARVRGSWSQPEQGGDALTIQVDDLDLRERGADRPLLGASSLKFTAPRLDGASGVIDVGEVTAEDLALEVVRLSDGGLRVAGVDLVSPEPGDGSEPGGTDTPGGTDPPGGAVEPSGAVKSGGTSRASEVASSGGEAPQPAARRRLRSVRLGALDLDLKELRLSTEGASADPFVVTSRVALKDAVEFGAEDFMEEAPPVEVAITASAQPGGASLSLDLALTPFDNEPEFDAKIQIEGLDGDFLRSVFPERQVASAESGFEGGSFSAAIHSQFRWRRGGPLDFDLRGGFGLGLEVNDLALRSKAGGPVTLGLDLLSLDAANISPRSGRYQFRRVEIENPQGVVRRVKGGLEIAGMLVAADTDEAADSDPSSAASSVANSPAELESTPKMDPAAPPGTEPGPASSASETDAGAEADVAEVLAAEESAAPGKASDGPPERSQGDGVAGAAQPARSGGPSANVTIDDLLLRDLDLLYEDLTVTPTLSIPLVAMDAEVRGLSSRMLTQPRPLRFSLSLGGGNVSLPVRLKQTSVLRGVAEGVAGAMSSREAEVVKYEDRPLFKELVSSGQLTFYPSTSGWVQGAIQGFELTALRGAAIASGIDIGDGVLDINSRSRLAGKRGGHVDSTVSFAHLSLSEPEGGPISRFLKLPAPLDTVVFVLKNEQGEIRLPLSFDFGGGSSMGMAEISAKASAAFLRLVTAALAAAPLRAVGSVTDVVGLGGLIGGRDRTPKYAGMEAAVDFAVGSAHVDSELPPALKAIVKAMAKDPLLELEGTHHFGLGDIERARELANPDGDVAVKLLQSLRRERDVLARQRGEVAAAARSHLTLARISAFEDAQAALVQISRELGEVETRVDQVAGLLGRNAAGKAERRRRRVALELAQARMDALMRALIREQVDQSRVNLKRPRYQPPEAGSEAQQSRVDVRTRAGTPRKGFFGRVFGFFGL